MKQWDIFCKIVDNFGDIGVCWRLAKQLSNEHNLPVRLWIDDLAVAKHLIPELDSTLQVQSIHGISIARWQADTLFNQTADVVIEAFGCELPPAYLARMQPRTVWINLEYLSAETWVEGFHGLNSKVGDLTRHFFFPGFTNATGGLIKEHNLLKSQQAFEGEASIQPLQHLDLAPDVHLGRDNRLKVSIFCYPHAPIKELLAAIADSDNDTDCYIPQSSILPHIAQFLGKADVKPGDCFTKNKLRLHILPFLSQQDYDKLLSACDINFVRGEDSWIRAIWAEKPFIWQPYWQTEETHLLKLNAFLNFFYADCDQLAKASVFEAHVCWATGKITTNVWRDYLNQRSTLKTHAQLKAKQLATQTDLVTNLVEFSSVIFNEKNQNNQV